MKKVNNDIVPTKQIPKDFINSQLYKTENIVIDLSFKGAFVSCKCNDFDNYLHDESEFVQKFKKMIENVNKLSDHTAEELMRDKGFRHCHKIEADVDTESILKEIARKIGKDDEYVTQLIGGENLYQLGFETEVRLIGLMSGNVFRTLFIDYHHNLYPDEKRNSRGRQRNNYSLM